MADALTPVLGLVKQTIGGNRNTWGGILNSCMDLIEGAFYGMTSKVVTGGSATLTDSERRKRILNFTGTLASDQTIVVANLVGRWTVRNATTGNFSLSMKTTDGDAVVIPQGGCCDVWCDGADGVYAGLSTRLRDTQMLAPDGTLAAPGLSWASELASGFYRVGSKVFAWVVDGVARVRVEASAFKVTLGDGVDVISATDTAVAVGVPLSAPSLLVGGNTVVPIGTSVDFDGILEPNGWKFRNGQSLSRTTHALLFEAITITATATRNGTTTLSSVDKDLTGLGLEGAQVEGTGITAGTTVASLTSTTITLSQTASGTGTMTIRLLPHGAEDTDTFKLPDDRGRVTTGRDDMGGIAASRITIGGLGRSGGSDINTLTQANLPNVSLGVVIPVQWSHSHTTDAKTSPANLAAGDGAFFGGGVLSQATINAVTMPQLSGSAALAGSGLSFNNVQPSRVSNKIIFTGLYT